MEDDGHSRGSSDDLRELFDELAELDETERAGRLTEIQARAPALHARLQALLAADRRADDVLRDHEIAAVRSIAAGDTVSDPLDLIGRTVGHYRVDGVLGAGGMGVVYRATDTRLGRSAALKFLPPAWSVDAHAKQRLLHEARSASSLDHPNVCTIYEADETADGALYLALAYYEGETVRDLLESGSLAVRDAIDIAEQTARGLAAAHGRGLVHRDIKPANLLITPGGTLKILDFGVAKAADVALTTPEQRPGTAAYMAPEQARGEAVDGRSDLWSLGVVLYEMLTGTRPPRSARPGHAIPPPSTFRADVPPALDAITLKLLAHDPADRPAGAPALADELARLRAGNGNAARLRTRVVAAAAVAMVVLVGGALGVRWLAQERMPVDVLVGRVQQLTADGRFVEAYALAEQMQGRDGADTLLAGVWPEIADWISLTTEPAGAQVLGLRYSGGEAPDAPDEWQLLGTTPLDSARVPRGDYLLRIRYPGRATVERTVSSALLRVMPAAVHLAHRVVTPEHQLGGDAELHFHLRLLPSDSLPADMVYVPGGRYELIGVQVLGFSTDLEPYFLDRFEVTNAQYAEFVQAGGYTERAFWQDLVAEVGDGWRSTVDELTDRTGLYAPRAWTGQQYPAGQEDHPVTGVTWYEAAAFCRFRDRRLPTLFEWDKAARDGLLSRFDGQILPWGYHTHGASVEGRANFGGSGTTPVHAHRFGTSPYGARGMAGNAKEWVSNATPAGRAFTGGSWEDPIYLFSQVGSVDRRFASASLGFRCASLTPWSDQASDQGGGLLDMGRPPPAYEPVDERTYRSLLSHYRYDRRPLNAEVLETVEAPGWIREKVAFDGPSGPAGSRVLGYLYLPRIGEPPFQTLLFTPGAGAFLGNTLAFETEWVLGPLIRSGRAGFSVVMTGMTEREWGADYQMPEPPSVAFRDLMVLHATELRTGLDYLATRPEIDTTAIAYVAWSMGAGSRLPWAAVDERFRAVILLGGGIDERVRPTLPEADNVNFAPYIRAPKLLLNGTADEDARWESRARPLWELLSKPKDLVLVPGAGHLVSPEQRIPAMREWLDRVFGPVDR